MDKLVVDIKPSAPGRPRSFDMENGLSIGQGLFHKHGYGGVGIAALTASLGIKPPSFYSAYGSKAAFFEQVLKRYAATELPLQEILLPGRAPDEALIELLGLAATRYASDPDKRGCLVLESVRDGDAESIRLARTIAENRRAMIREFIAVTHPDIASGVTDFIASTMSGLSASAREHFEVERLKFIAEMASRAITATFSDCC